MKRFAPVLLLFAAACKGESAPDLEQVNAGPPPAELCTQVKKQLADLDKQLTVEYDDKGEATVEQATWLAMTPENHADFARTLAFVAACASGRQSEAQPVRIRNESGMMLLETNISTKVDLRSVLRK